MSTALVERPFSVPDEWNNQSLQVDRYFASLPEELMPTVQTVCQMALDLLQVVQREVGSVKLKLLLPVPTYKAGFILWRQSYVLIEDLEKFDFDLDRFVQTVIKEGAAVSVEELNRHHFEVQSSQNFTAKWYPSSKTIKLSIEVIKKGLAYTLFELTNASFNKRIQELFKKPKGEQVVELEKIEFETTAAVRERLEELGFQDNIYRLTHRHFKLHFLHQELKGHVAQSARYFGQSASSAWPYPMTNAEREKLKVLVDAHIYALYGNIEQKKLGKIYISRLSDGIEGNIKLNWDWYQELYQKLTQGE